MGLETATYVNQLNSLNPAATDGLAQADDHLRLIKNTLKGTFPNLDSAVTATPAQLNALSGTSITQASISKLQDITATAAEVNILDGATLSTVELNYVDGVTGSIQTQLDTKAPSASPTLTGTTTVTTVNLGAFTVTQDAGGRLDFRVGGTVMMSLDQSGNLRVVGDISAFDTSA